MTENAPTLTPEQQAALLACYGQLLEFGSGTCQHERVTSQPWDADATLFRCEGCGVTVIRPTEAFDD